LAAPAPIRFFRDAPPVPGISSIIGRTLDFLTKPASRFYYPFDEQPQKPQQPPSTKPGGIRVLRTRPAAKVLLETPARNGCTT
jgi:hypothetical protein